MIDPNKPDYDNTPSSSQRPVYDYEPQDKERHPYVTIVTPFYNVGEVFYETARSVMQQSFQQWEWLIINDGSTDPVAISILDKFRDKDPRIRVIDHDRNKGPSAARNAGYQHAGSKYVFQIDSDDLMEPSTIEKCLWFLESHPEYGFVKGYTVGFQDQQYLWNKGFHHNQEFLSTNMATITTMVRKETHAKVGGYDEGITWGKEDWDFWLNCADHGIWGSTIPEYLDWYRRRSTHPDDWTNWDGGKTDAGFNKVMRNRYPRLFKGKFPEVKSDYGKPYQALCTDLPCENRLAKHKPRLLMILPWVTMGGSDKFNLNLIHQLNRHGWEVTIATTFNKESVWLPEFAKATPDIFMLHNFLKPADYPRFLQYLINSRRPDIVMVSNSELGYMLLPYLRAYCPESVYLDYCHMEEEDWKNGGYPRFGVGFQGLLDLNIVASQHLKDWMVNRGADSERVEVCYINVDTEKWGPRPEVRKQVRANYKIGEDKTVILYACRLCAQKQPRVFARVMLELKECNLDYLALVAGDGEDREWLVEFIKNNRLSNHIRMLGAVPSDTIRDLMAASDILFLPSLWEGIALSIYEAMAVGLAVVGAVVGGQRELVTPECGILLPKGDEEEEVKAYTEELSRIISNPMVRNEMEKNARSRVCEFFSLPAMGERMVELFGLAGRLKERHPRAEVNKALGLECATQALEFLRLSQFADQLWSEREGIFKRPGLESADRMENQLYQDLRIQAELEYIENSRSWRVIQRFKRIWIYRLFAYIVHGKDWDRNQHYNDPRERLAAIKKSRSFRMLQAVKGTSIYRVYARRKYGPNYINPFETRSESISDLCRIPERKDSESSG
ncbi:MAG: glycosyltransferase [Planctomycetota bacterium]|jgi:glycosyltransferase involved in cell wall biosynthesis